MKKVRHITKHIHNIKRPEEVYVLTHTRPLLCVVENNMTRTLPISRKVAAVLIARGFAYGN